MFSNQRTVCFLLLQRSETVNCMTFTAGNEDWEDYTCRIAYTKKNIKNKDRRKDRKEKTTRKLTLFLLNPNIIHSSKSGIFKVS